MPLIVELDLDSGTFEKKMKGAGDTGEKQANRMRDAFAGAAKAAAGIGLAIAGVAARLTGDAIILAESFDKMSQRTGFAVKTLSTLKFAAEQSGTSIQGLEVGLRRFSRVIIEAGDGLGEASRGFERIGISVRDTQGNLKSNNVLFFEAAEALSRIDDETKKVAAAQELFGRAGTQLLPLLNQGAEGIRALQQEARDFGAEIDKQTAKQAARVLDDINAFKTAIQGLGLTLAKEFLPEIREVTKDIKDWSKNMEGVKDVASAVLTVITKIKDGVKFISQGLGASVAAAEQFAQGNAQAAARALGGGRRTEQALGAAQALSGGPIGVAAGAVSGRTLAEALPGVGGLIKLLPGGSAAGGVGAGAGGAGGGGGTGGGIGGGITGGGGGVGAGGIVGGGGGGGAGDTISEIGQRVRAFWGRQASEGTRMGILDGGKKAAGKATTKSKTGLAGQIFTGALSGAKAALLSGDAKAAGDFFSKGFGNVLKEEAKKAIIAALGKKLLGKLGGLGIPGFQGGTDSAPGGLALVGERGPELVTLPRGAQVATAEETRSMMGGVTVQFLGPVSLGTPDASADAMEDLLETRIADGLEQNRLPNFSEGMRVALGR